MIKNRAKEIRVGSLVLDNPVFLAPMTSVTDLPFRKMVRRLGGGLVYSEMIASQEMIKKNDRSLKMAETDSRDGPMAVQLAGCEPSVMAEAAKINEGLGAAVIDINMGCPVKKIVNGQAGSALMRDEILAAAIMKAVVQAVSVPVTLKMRLGWDHEHLNAPRLARIAEDLGIKMVTIHGRTRMQMYKGRADWRAVRPVREAISLPLLVNGDIDHYDAVDAALEQSGADGVMIGRGAYGRPWFPGMVSSYLMTGDRPAEPDKTARLGIVLDHYRAMLAHHGPKTGPRMARKHLGWYLDGESQRLDADIAGIKKDVMTLEDPKAVEDCLMAFFAQLPETVQARNSGSDAITRH